MDDLKQLEENIVNHREAECRITVSIDGEVLNEPKYIASCKK